MGKVHNLGSVFGRVPKPQLADKTGGVLRVGGIRTLYKLPPVFKF